MAPDKKLQKGGYAHNSFSQIRGKLSRLFDTEDTTAHIRLKKKKLCRGGKEHYFIRISGDKKSFFGYTWVEYQCDVCGKRKTVSKKDS